MSTKKSEKTRIYSCDGCKKRCLLLSKAEPASCKAGGTARWKELDEFPIKKGGTENENA